MDAGLFDEHSKAIFQTAVKLAKDCDSDFISTKYILFAIARSNIGRISHLLSANNVTLEELEFIGLNGPIGRPAPKPKRMPYTQNAKNAIEMALLHAQQTEQPKVTPDILLLGILSAGLNKANSAIDCLKSIGADIASMKYQLLTDLSTTKNDQ